MTIDLLRRRAMLAGLTLLAPVTGGAEMPANLSNTPGTRAAQAIPCLAPAKPSARFPNILLHTQDGKPVRFYDDLVKGRIALINLMYTSCEGICPTSTANLLQVYQRLGRRVGRDIFMLSISVDRNDTPKKLKEYAQMHGSNKPGWLYLTGNYGEITALRRSLGMYDLDPAVDADKSSHSGIVTFGNDRTDRWSALAIGMDSYDLVQRILQITSDRL